MGGDKGRNKRPYFSNNNTWNKRIFLMSILHQYSQGQRNKEHNNLSEKRLC